MTAVPSTTAQLAWVALWNALAPALRGGAIWSALAPALRGGAIWLLGGVLAAGTAHAYSAPEAYAELAYQGGGEGRWFTGSPADGFGCGVCHTPAAGQREYPLYVQGLPTERGYALAAQHQ